MNIKKLELSNIQCIENYDAEFVNGVYLFTGENEVGKSTLLKTIFVLLTGKRDAILKNGESKGYAKMTLGDDTIEYEVELKCTKANPKGTLTITNTTTGKEYNGPTALQDLFDYKDFDAVDFVRWSETAEGRRKQVEAVMNLFSKDERDAINAIDDEVAEIKEQRKDANVMVKTCTTLATTAGKQLKPGDTQKYAEKLDIAELMAEQAEDAKLIEKAKGVRERLNERKAYVESADAIFKNVTDAYNAEINAANAEIEKAKKLIEEAEERKKNAQQVAIDANNEINAKLEDAKSKIEKAEAWMAAYEEDNPEKKNTAERIKGIEEHNRMYAIVQDYNAKSQQKKEAEKVVADFEKRLEQLAEQRAGIIENANIPIEGLTFSESGLILNDVPFESGKVSDSQIMEVATKLIMASNPNIKVFRIARGESLGKKRLDDICKMAKENGFQGFIEVVKPGQNDLITEEYTVAE